MKLPELEPVDHEKNKLRMLLYGQTGSGKTTTAATAARHPGFCDVVVLNYDRGQVSLPENPHLRLINLAPDQSALELVQVVATELSKPADRRQPGWENINTLIIDSVSAFRYLAVDEIQRKIGKTSYTVWNEMHAGFIGALDRLIASQEVHLILLAGAREQILEGGSKDIRPELNPALWRMVTYRMDIILYCDIRNGLYVLQTKPKSTATTVKIRNRDFAKRVREHNIKFNRQELERRGVDTTDMSDQALEGSMISTEDTLARLYSIYLQEEN